MDGKEFRAAELNDGPSGHQRVQAANYAICSAWRHANWMSPAPNVADGPDRPPRRKAAKIAGPGMPKA